MKLGVINAHSNDAGLLLSERWLCSMESCDFGRTDKGKIVWIKEQHHHVRANAVEAKAAYATIKRTWQIPIWGDIAWLEHDLSPSRLADYSIL
jgi:hypothetical protein